MAYPLIPKRYTLLEGTLTFASQCRLRFANKEIPNYAQFLIGRSGVDFTSYLSYPRCLFSRSLKHDEHRHAEIVSC